MVNLFIDSNVQRRRRFSPPPLTGEFVEEYEQGMGVIRLSDGNQIDVPLEPGVYAPGAVVTVDRDGSGRAIRAWQPKELPAESDATGVGFLGRTILTSRAKASEAWEQAKKALADVKITNDAVQDLTTQTAGLQSQLAANVDQVNTRLNAVDVALAETGGQVFTGSATPQNPSKGDLWVQDSVVRVWDGTAWRVVVDNAGTRALITSAQQSADQAKQSATAAAQKATQAQTTATQAQTAAGQAQTAANSATAKATQAQQTAGTAQATANQAKTVAETGNVSLTRLTTGNMSSTVATKIWDVVRAKLVVAQNIITGNMLASNAVEARHIVASESLTAKIAQFLKVTTSQLILGKHVRWTDDSLTFYQIPPGNPSDSQLQQWHQRTPAIRLSPDGSSYISLADSSGGVATSMNADGLVTARNVTVSGEIAADSMSVAGIPIVDYVLADQVQLMGYSSLPPLTHPAGTQNITMAEVEMTLPPGLYKVSWAAEMNCYGSVSGSDAGGLIVLMRKRVGTSWQNLHFEHNRSQIEGWVTAGTYWNVTAEGYFRLSAETTVKFLLNVHSYLKRGVSVNPSLFGVWLLPESKEAKYTLVSHASSSPAPAPAKTQHVKTYQHNAFRTFFEDGRRAGDYASLFAQNATVGDNPYYESFRGASKCMFFFPSWTGDLAGATVKKVEIGFTVKHTYYGAGSDFILGYHGTSNNGVWSKFGGDYSPRHAVAGQTIWVTVPANELNHFRTGAVKGVVFTAPNRNFTYNGQIAGVQVRITYEK